MEGSTVYPNLALCRLPSEYAPRKSSFASVQGVCALRLQSVFLAKSDQQELCGEMLQTQTDWDETQAGHSHSLAPTPFPPFTAPLCLRRPDTLQPLKRKGSGRPATSSSHVPRLKHFWSTFSSALYFEGNFGSARCSLRILVFRNCIPLRMCGELISYLPFVKGFITYFVYLC